MSKSAFAELAGVTPTAITKATRPGGMLEVAMCGRKINAAHPAAKDYVKAKAPSVTVSVNGGDPVPLEDFEGPKATRPSGHRAASESRKSMGYNVDPAELPDNMQQFAEMTIREAVAKFGTDYRLVDFLRAMKEIEVIEERRIKSAKAKGELVHRDLIKKGIIDPIDTAYRKMLTDGAKTIARRAAAMVEAGRDVGDLEKFVADQITSFIKPAKASMKRALEHE